MLRVVKVFSRGEGKKEGGTEVGMQILTHAMTKWQ